MSTVEFVITNSRNSLSTERRFTTEITVNVLKGKLELLTGIVMQDMRLEVFDKSDNLVYNLDQDDRTLSSYPVINGMRLHVVDITNRCVDMEEELSKVKKFELTDEDYAKRDGTVRAFKQQLKLGQFDAEKQRIVEEREAAEKQMAGSMKVGDRCEASVEGQTARRGVISFIGEVAFKPGQVWVGIRYDEPVGKNNGSVQGHVYFVCPDKYGGFVRPSALTVGDFPPLIDSELDEI